MQRCCLFKSELGACLLSKDSISKSVFWQTNVGQEYINGAVSECAAPFFSLQSSQTHRFAAHLCRLWAVGALGRKNWGPLDWARHLPLAMSTPKFLLLISYTGCPSCAPACLAFRLVASPWLWEMCLPGPQRGVHLVWWTAILHSLLIAMCLPSAYVHLIIHLDPWMICLFWSSVLLAHLIVYPYFVEASGLSVSCNPLRAMASKSCLSSPGLLAFYFLYLTTPEMQNNTLIPIYHSLKHFLYL